MSASPPPLAEEEPAGVVLPRVLGDLRGERPGPLLIVLGGMHGNEPAGALAARRVTQALEGRRGRLRGRCLALAGNLEALAHRRRFLDCDLNRIWSAADVAARRAPAAAGEPQEFDQQRELLAVIDAALAEAPGEVVFIDLHSASAAGPPFCLIGDTLSNREIAFSLRLPVILGLEENVEGTILEHFANLGHVAVGVEGGQHRDPAAVDHHESVIWISLIAAGLLEEADVPELERHRRRLAEATAGLPHVLEVLHRHGLQPGEVFEMEPGYANFHPVQRGRLLAHGADGTQAVHAPLRGLLLLPRYQGQGLDGFFIGRPVRRFWLHVSAFLRRLRLERVLAWLPGVSRSAESPGVLWVDPRVARWLSVQVFHLLGYRRCRPEAGRLIFTRRLEGPPTQPV